MYINLRLLETVGHAVSCLFADYSEEHRDLEYIDVTNSEEIQRNLVEIVRAFHKYLIEF